jgi:hypothetical protein
MAFTKDGRKYCDKIVCGAMRWATLTSGLVFVFDIIFMVFLMELKLGLMTIPFVFFNPIVLWLSNGSWDLLMYYPAVMMYHFVFFFVFFLCLDKFKKRKSDTGALWLFLLFFLIWAYFIQGYLFLIVTGYTL